MKSAERFAAPPDGHLDEAMRAAWQRDGFLVLENFKSAGQLLQLRRRIDELVEDFDPESVRTIFSTSEQSHAADDYFRESGDKVRFFFETGAFSENGELTVEKRLGLNKIGHAMHDLDPVFDDYCRDPRLAALAGDLGIADPGLIQSMVIFKQPRIGGEVGMHQDASFLYTEPVSITGFWFALEDADAENGCLVAVPGAHGSPLAERFRYHGDDLRMDRLTDPGWPGWNENDLVALEAPAGTLVVLHGLLPHGSAPNHSARSREAFALHVYDRSSQWFSDNWLKRSGDMPVRGFA
jgi:phytanoyl-CoA hydroxylase